MSAHVTAASATVYPRAAGSGLIDQLNAEWARLSDDPRTRVGVAGWIASAPDLAGCSSIDDVRARLATATRPEQDAILITLLTAGHRGDHLAHRTVFQAFLGAALSRGFSHPCRDHQSHGELATDITTALWTAIATYPLHRTARVPANLIMETVHHLSVIRSAHHLPETPHDPLSATTGDAADVPLDLTPVPGRWISTGTNGHPATELVNAVAYGLDAGAITAHEAALLIRVYCPPPGQSGGRDVAAELGISWPTLRQQCSRAARALAATIRNDAAHHS